MDTTQKGDIIDIETVKPPEIEGVFLVAIELMLMTGSTKVLLIQWLLFIISFIAKTDEEMEEQEYKRRKALMSTTSIQSRSAENSQTQGKIFTRCTYLSKK